MTTIPWDVSLLAWQEAYRYRDSDAVVHCILVVRIGGPYDVKLWGCHTKDDAVARVRVSQNTLITCIACLARVLSSWRIHVA